MRDLIDLYVQLGRDVWLAEHRAELAHRSTLADLAQLADAYRGGGWRLRAAGVLPFPSAADGLFAAANAEVEQAARDSHPQLEKIALLPLYAVVPGVPASAELLRARLRAGAPCLGIKLWPYMGRFSLAALRSDAPLLELVREHRLLVSVHVGTGREKRSREVFADVRADPLAALELAAALPDVLFHFSHLLRLSRAALAAVPELGNVFLDTSGLTTLGHWREEGRDVLPAEDAGALAALPPQQILAELAGRPGLAETLSYGSNWPFCTWWKSHPAAEVALIESSPLPETTRQKICFDNAVRLLERLGSPAARDLLRGLA